MALLRSLQFALLVSTATFSVLTLPWLRFAQEPVDIRVNYQPQFLGKLGDLAPPYLGGVTLLSLSLGATAFSVSAWQASRRDRQTLFESINSLEQQLQNKRHQVEVLQLSEARLQVAGLTAFMETDLPRQPLALKAASSAVVRHPLATSHPLAIAQAETSQIQTSPTRTSQLRQISKLPLASAHAFSVQAGYDLAPVTYRYRGDREGDAPRSA